MIMENISSDFLPTIPPIAVTPPIPAEVRDGTLPNFQHDARQALLRLWQKLNVEFVLKPIEPVSAQPATKLHCWSMQRVYFLDGTSSSHLVGTTDGDARVTSAVHSIYPLSRHAVTTTGRVYLLDKSFGYSMQAESLFANWLKRNAAQNAIDQTRDMLSLQRRGLIGLLKLGKFLEHRSNFGTVEVV